MQPAAKATRIHFFNFTMPQMRAFHMTWVAFFLCFVGWFAIAPLSAVIQKDLNLTDAQLANTVIASVAITILARLAIGAMCDRYGPRRTYTWLMIIGSIPIMAIGLATNYTTFLLGRLAIGAIGASFVVTQFHTTQMFATNCVGAAKRDCSRLGQYGRRRDEHVDARNLRRVRLFRMQRASGVAAGDDCSGCADDCFRNRVLVPDTGLSPRQFRGFAEKKAL